MKIPLSVAMIGVRGLPATDGGAEKGAEGLSLALARRGHQVTVYGRSGYCDRGLRYYNGVRQIPLTQVDTKHLEAVSHTALATAHALARRREYDLIHFHATGPSLFCWFPVLNGVPTVGTIQGLDWKREKWGTVARTVLRLGARVASTVPDETIVVSRVLQSLVRQAYGRESHYIPNGVELPERSSAGDLQTLVRKPYILFLGRLVPEKQVHVLLSAFAKVSKDVQLIIAGSPSHSDEYAAEIRQMAATDRRVTFVGSRYGAEKVWLLRNAAVFVQPSTIEGLPIALLEALACDQLTIVSDIPENVEAITVGQNQHGLVFRTRDGDDLALKVQQALDPEFAARHRVPSVGRLVREQYSWDCIAEQTEAVYCLALDRRRENGRLARAIPRLARVDNGSGLSASFSERNMREPGESTA